jgi:sterol 14-demethylase
MSDEAIAHLMIALLMGGQHTSSTTTSWLLFELAKSPDMMQVFYFFSRFLIIILTGL